MYVCMYICMYREFAQGGSGWYVLVSLRHLQRLLLDGGALSLRETFLSGESICTVWASLQRSERIHEMLQGLNILEGHIQMEEYSNHSSSCDIRPRSFFSLRPSSPRPGGGGFRGLDTFCRATIIDLRLLFLGETFPPIDIRRIVEQVIGMVFYLITRREPIRRSLATMPSSYPTRRPAPCWFPDLSFPFPFACFVVTGWVPVF